MAWLYDRGMCREETSQEGPAGTVAGHSAWGGVLNGETDLNRLRLWIPEMTEVGTLTPRWGGGLGPARGLETLGNPGATDCPESGSCGSAVRDHDVMDAYHEIRILMTFSPDDSKKKGRIKVVRDGPSRTGSPGFALSCAETACSRKGSRDDSFHDDCCCEMQLGLGGTTTPSSASDGEPGTADAGRDDGRDDGRASIHATRAESGGVRDELLAAQQRIRELELLLVETQRENRALQDARQWSVAPEIAVRYGIKKAQDASSGPVAKRSLYLEHGATVVF